MSLEKGFPHVSAFPSPEALAKMVNAVTGTMMNVHFHVAEAPEVLPFRRAVLPIPGELPVSVVVSSDQQSAQFLGSKLFSVDPAAVDTSMIEDTLREIANITAGQVKRAMKLDQALGLPSIVDGSKALQVRAEASGKRVILRADGAVHLEVQIASLQA